MNITRFDAAEHLIDDEMIVEYLNAILEDDPDFLPQALGTVIRARGVSRISRDAGLSRETIYSAFTAGANPTYATLIKVLTVLNLRPSLVKMT
jgi:probable addiction module antidote protein